MVLKGIVSQCVKCPLPPTHPPTHQTDITITSLAQPTNDQAFQKLAIVTTQNEHLSNAHSPPLVHAYKQPSEHNTCGFTSRSHEFS